MKVFEEIPSNISYNPGMETETYRFETALDVTIFTQPASSPSAKWFDWLEFDQSPGIFHLPVSDHMGIRAKGFTDPEIKQLTDDLESVTSLRYLHLAENRGITNRGIRHLERLPQLAYLNLSSCDISSEGLAFLPALRNLTHLDLSYCNRLTANAAKYIQKLPALKFLDLQGVLKINTGSVKKFERRGLEIYRG
jgi:hypothetical protein